MVGGTRGRFLRSTKRDSGGTTGTVLDVPHKVERKNRPLVPPNSEKMGK